MLRNQTKRQSSFYVCASCRRQNHKSLAHLRTSSHIPNEPPKFPSRPFSSTSAAVLKLPNSRTACDRLANSLDHVHITFARNEARGYASWGKFGAPSMSGQSNSAWANASKMKPMGNTSSTPVFGGPPGGLAPPVPGGSPWGGDSKINPAGAVQNSSPSFRGPSSGTTAAKSGPSAWGGASRINQSSGSSTSPPVSRGPSDATIPPKVETSAWGRGAASPTAPTTLRANAQPRMHGGQGQTLRGWGRVDNARTGGLSPNSSSSGSGPREGTARPSPPMSSAHSGTTTGQSDRPLGSTSTTIPGKPAFGNATGPAFGGSGGAFTGKPAFGGASGSVPRQPAFGTPSTTPVTSTSGVPVGKLPDPKIRPSSIAPAKSAFSQRYPNSITSAYAPKAAKNVPVTTLGNPTGGLSHLSPELLSPGYDARSQTQPSRSLDFIGNRRQAGASPSRENLRQRVQSILDTPFGKLPSRDPGPGEEFPLLRRKPKNDLFESMSPFTLPTRSPQPSSTSPSASMSGAAADSRPQQTLQPKSTGTDAISAALLGGRITESAIKQQNFGESKGDIFGESAKQNFGEITLEAMTVDSRRPEEVNSSGWQPYRGSSSTVNERTDLPNRRIERDHHKGKPSKKDEYSDRRGKSARPKNKSRRGEQSYGHSEEWEGMEIDELEEMEQEKRRRQSQADRLAEESAKKAAAPKTMVLPEYIAVYDLAEAVRVKPQQFLRDLEELGFENILHDSVFTGETAALVAAEYGYETTVESGDDVDLRPRPPPEDLSNVPLRPPIVTIMGHVDHGKTTMLDWMRKSSVAAQEHGGITQHIGAFAVRLASDKDRLITFLDTPGHAAFLSMRQRGANVTDMVILVVAVDDSVMPQTIEAIKHAQSAKVPMIVAINKVDLDPDRVGKVKDDLANNGIEIEDYGGDVQVIPVSAKTGQGMKDLEEAILTLSEILDVRAEPNGLAEGWILEASTKPDGRAATILVKRGTLRKGDLIVAGTTYTRVRIMRSEAGLEVLEVGPGTAVEIYGTWRVDPVAGDMVLQAPNEAKAQAAVNYRQDLEERAEAAAQKSKKEAIDREEAARKALEEEMAELGGDEAREAASELTGPKMVNIIVRGDVMGSVEAVTGSLQEIGNNEVQTRILRSLPGQITESDVDLMALAAGCIVNFNQPIPGHIQRKADVAGVRILDRNIIYEVIDEVKLILSEQLAPLYSQRVLAEAEVMAIFPINIVKRKYKNIAGVRVTNNTITRGGNYRVMRNGEEVHKGKLEALKNVKKDVAEMKKGTECGMMFEDFDAFQVGDHIQKYEDVEEKRYL